MPKRKGQRGLARCQAIRQKAEETNTSTHVGCLRIFQLHKYGGVDMALDQGKLQRFLQKALDEIGATFHASLVVIGDQL
jgi:hypothetical protein